MPLHNISVLRGVTLQSADVNRYKPMVEPNQLKICFLAGTLGRGGAERQLIYMLKALHRAGIQTRVLCLTKGEPLEEEIQELGVSVTWVGQSRKQPIRLYRIIQELRREPAHILQSAHFYANLYVAAASRVLRIKCIGAIRNNLSSELESNGRMGQWHLRSPHHLIANSEVGRNCAVNEGIDPQKLDFVQNAVDVQFCINDVDRNRDSIIRILFVGRLFEQKRADRFLRVFNNAFRQRPDLKVKGAIAGDGPLRPGLEQLAEQLKLGSDDVEFLGDIKDVKPHYYQSDFLVLTSDWEGTPNVLLEAMACGLPIVATRVGGVPEIVETDRGLLVEPDDEVGLTAATVRMIGDRDLRNRLRDRGAEYVSARHSLHALENQLTSIYRRILL